MEDVSKFMDGDTRKCLPNITFEGRMHFPEDGITIFHSPFHTPDCISIYDAADKVLYTGDNFGIIEGKAVLWGNDITACAKMIETYKAFDFDVCVPAHDLRGSDAALLSSKEVIALLKRLTLN